MKAAVVIVGLFLAVSLYVAMGDGVYRFAHTDGEVQGFRAVAFVISLALLLLEVALIIFGDFD